MTRIRPPTGRATLAGLLLVLSAAACGDITGDDSSSRWLAGFIAASPVPALNTTHSNPVFFWVEDEDGGVADVELHLSVRGDATVDPTTARTDESGYVRTSLTLGDTPGRVYITARIAGTTDSAMVSVEPVRRNLELEPDSLRILLGCGLGARVRIGPRESFGFDTDEVDPGIRFDLTDSSVVHLVKSGGTDYRRAVRGVISDKLGTTRLIASFVGAAPDTTPVTVLPVSEAIPTRIELSALDTVAVGGGPYWITGYVYELGGCLLDDEVGFVSRNPDVLAVDSQAGGSVPLDPRSSGSAWIVGRAGELVDSLLVHVR